MRYRLKYKVDWAAGNWTKEEILASGDGHGGADALVLISIITPEDGGYSQMVVSHDGRTNKALTPRDLWKAWLLLAARLKEDPKLDEWRRTFAAATFDTAMETLTGKKAHP